MAGFQGTLNIGTLGLRGAPEYKKVIDNLPHNKTMHYIYNKFVIDFIIMI